MKPSDIEFFRPADVAEIMGWTESTLANYRTNGGGPPYTKVRNRVLYSKVEFYRWIKEQNRAKKAERKARKAVA